MGEETPRTQIHAQGWDQPPPAKPTPTAAPRHSLGRRIARVLVVGLLAALLVAVLIVGWLEWRINGALPPLDGTIAVAGLSAPVTVERDGLGVPTITAENRR